MIWWCFRMKVVREYPLSARPDRPGDEVQGTITIEFRFEVREHSSIGSFPPSLLSHYLSCCLSCATIWYNSKRRDPLLLQALQETLAGVLWQMWQAKGSLKILRMLPWTTDKWSIRLPSCLATCGPQQEKPTNHWRAEHCLSAFTAERV